MPAMWVNENTITAGTCTATARARLPRANCTCWASQTTDRRHQRPQVPPREVEDDQRAETGRPLPDEPGELPRQRGREQAERGRDHEYVHPPDAVLRPGPRRQIGAGSADVEEASGGGLIARLRPQGRTTCFPLDVSTRAFRPAAFRCAGALHRPAGCARPAAPALPASGMSACARPAATAVRPSDSWYSSQRNDAAPDAAGRTRPALPATGFLKSHTDRSRTTRIPETGRRRAVTFSLLR